MTVQTVKLETVEGGENADNVNYRLKYLVSTDDRDDGPLTVRNAVGWAYGDPYLLGNDSDPRSVATSITENLVSDAHYLDWEVVVSFEAIDTDLDLTNPLNDPVEEEVIWRPVRRQIYIDRDGNWIGNTAGDRYVGGLEGEDNVPNLVYSLNQAAFPFAVAQANRNAVNSAIWKGFAAKTVKVAGITSRRKYHRTIGVYYNVSYSFLTDANTFDVPVPSHGYNEITGTPKKKKPIIVQGKRPPSPQPLDAVGKAIAFDPDTRVWASLPAVQNHGIYPLADFNSLFPFL